MKRLFELTSTVFVKLKPVKLTVGLFFLDYKAKLTCKSPLDLEEDEDFLNLLHNSGSQGKSQYTPRTGSQSIIFFLSLNIVGVFRESF